MFPKYACRLDQKLTSNEHLVCILVAMVTSKTPEGNQEFQIHNEDFPALPGTQPSESGQQLPDHKQSECFMPLRVKL